MPMHYLDPKRESDPHALPNVETFQVRDGDDTRGCDSDGDPLASGWYWWSCFPGCLPDSDPCGPFATEAEALADAREGVDDVDES